MRYNPIQMAKDIIALIDYIDFLHDRDALGYNIFVDKIHKFNKIKKRYIQTEAEKDLLKALKGDKEALKRLSTNTLIFDIPNKKEAK